MKDTLIGQTIFITLLVIAVIICGFVIAVLLTLGKGSLA